MKSSTFEKYGIHISTIGFPYHAELPPESDAELLFGIFSIMVNPIGIRNELIPKFEWVRKQDNPNARFTLTSEEGTICVYQKQAFLWSYWKSETSFDLWRNDNTYDETEGETPQLILPTTDVHEMVLEWLVHLERWKAEQK